MVGLTEKKIPQKYEKIAAELNDRLSQLPDEILVSILSSFKLREAAKFSLVSHKWNYLWRNILTLKFEVSSVMVQIREDELMRKISNLDVVVGQERLKFVKWVNHVVESHLGSAINEFTVAFDLDNNCRSHIDKWVVFALEKQVKKLELDFTPASLFYYKNSEFNRYTLPPPCELPHNLTGIKPALTSLCLKHVNATTEAVECLLLSCLHLEDLYISKSEYLTHIRPSGSPLSLKHLQVHQCRNMEAIDVCARKLLSFKYTGCPIRLHIRNASSLYEVSITGFREDDIMYAFDSLSEYFSQFEFLHLRMCLFRELNLGINRCPVLTKLKHLELDVRANFDQTLLGWIPLIEACPVLQKLKLEFQGSNFPCPTREVKHGGGCPLKCLKTLEIVGFIGCIVDLDLVNFVLENCMVLEEVTVELTESSTKDVAETRAMELGENLQPGVKFTIKPSSAFQRFRDTYFKPCK